MKQLSLPAPAKINLLLHITGQRRDGYHELQTLFQFLDLADELSLTLRDDGEVLLESALEGVTRDKNLVWKAAQALLPYRSDPQQGVSLKLTKRLPLGGGLGAGSSDAASTLLGLNHLWQLNLSLDDLAAIGLRLGADVPVFVRGTTAWAEGVGEQLEAMTLSPSDYLLVHPGCHSCTKTLFSHPQLPRSTARISQAQALDYLGSNDFSDLAKALYPAIGQCFDWLEARGYQPWLTGSGACVLIRLPDPKQGQQLLQQLPASWGAGPVQAWLVQSRQTSPAHQVLNLLSAS